jgi:hypothetical protein
VTFWKISSTIFNGLEEETLQKHIKKCKKIIGQLLLTVSYKKLLGKVFAPGFDNGFL